MKSGLFCDPTQRRVKIPYRRFGTTYRYHLQGSNYLALKDGICRLSQNVRTELPLYAAYGPLFNGQVHYLTTKNGICRLSQNVGTELPLYAAYDPLFNGQVQHYLTTKDGICRLSQNVGTELSPYAE